MEQGTNQSGSPARGWFAVALVFCAALIVSDGALAETAGESDTKAQIVPGSEDGLPPLTARKLGEPMSAIWRWVLSSLLTSWTWVPDPAAIRFLRLALRSFGCWRSLRVIDEMMAICRLIMPPVTGILLLLGVYKGGIYGGSITAILINAPGTPAASCTVLDGYPLAKRGEARRALDIALYASCVADFVSNISLILFAGMLAW